LIEIISLPVCSLTISIYILLLNQISNCKLVRPVTPQLALKLEAQKFCCSVSINPTKHGNKTTRTHLYVSSGVVRADGRVPMDLDYILVWREDSYRNRDILTRKWCSSSWLAPWRRVLLNRQITTIYSRFSTRRAQTGVHYCVNNNHLLATLLKKNLSVYIVTPLSLRFTLKLLLYLYQGLRNNFCLPGLLILVYRSFYHVFYISLMFHSSWFDHLTNVWRKM
jgi:hypothetical protein